MPFGEWNDRFRNAVRSFWLADPARAAHGLPGHRVRDLATRLSGSVDLFGHSDPPLTRGPVASVNYVTAHDGFTLADLVAYDHKHNAANGEHNRDGCDDNRSWNHGIEGPVNWDSPAVDIVPLRRRSIRNLFATLVLAAGAPMITAGDEMGRTQQGNNNAYCQDNEISWMRWDLTPVAQGHARDGPLAARAAPRPPRAADRAVLHRPAGRAGTRPDLAWYDALGIPFDHARWHDPSIRTLQMVRSAAAAGATTPCCSSSTARSTRCTSCWPTTTAAGGAWRGTRSGAPGRAARGGDRGRAARRAGRGAVIEPMSMRVYVLV